MDTQIERGCPSARACVDTHIRGYVGMCVTKRVSRCVHGVPLQPDTISFGLSLGPDQSM